MMAHEGWGIAHAGREQHLVDENVLEGPVVASRYSSPHFDSPKMIGTGGWQTSPTVSRSLQAAAAVAMSPHSEVAMKRLAE
jgi:hypothetical protein